MDKFVCKESKCCGCYACVAACPQNAIYIEDNMQVMIPKINTEKCIECNKCYKVCPNHTYPRFRRTKRWYQGWINDSEKRHHSSSGGFARAVTEYFLMNEGYVCSCVFEKGTFLFKIINTIEDADIFAGSKYVKSNPKNCYKIVKDYVDNGEKVLFIGLPCQVAGVLNYVGFRKNNLYTIDLICHGTPSIKILEKYFYEMGKELISVENIIFRDNNICSLGGTVRFTDYGVMDRYLIAFLSGICYTENCYNCQYANQKRVSDITIGDSWGSDIKSEVNKGISLILCQTNKGVELVEKCEFKLMDVDIQNALQNNKQLIKPSERLKHVDSFFLELNEGKKFNNLVFKYCTYSCIKQILKSILIRFHLWRPKI